MDLTVPSKDSFLIATINLLSPYARDKRKPIFIENKQKLCPADSTNKAVSVFTEHMKTMSEKTATVSSCWSDLPCPRTYANHPSVSWVLTFSLLKFTAIMGTHAGSWHISSTNRGDR